jgi:Putative MetA-pathway of phenol degradation
MHPVQFRILLLVIVITFIGKVDTFAQLPFYTDDADTTTKGKFHLEIFDEHDVLQRASYPAKRQNTIVFTIDYGITNRLELGVNAPLITLSNSKISQPRNVTGVGDTQFGLKYNFLTERDGSKMPAMSLVFYIEAPTGNTEKQLGSGLTDYWLYGIVQKSLTKKTKGRLNGGILFSGNTSTGLIGIRSVRGHIYTGNVSLVRDFTDRLKLGLELFGAVTSSFALNRGQLTAQFGGDYALSKKLTLSFGLLGGRFSASPRAGAHLGFAYDF